MTRLLMLFVLSFYSFPTVELKVVNTGVCLLSYCECISSTHPIWTSINCTVPPNQNLDLKEGDIPLSTTDLIVHGAESLMFFPNSLSGLKDMRQIQIYNTNIIKLRTSTAVDLDVVSLMLEIENCNELSFEQRTFKGIKGPLSITVRNCQSMSVETEAFSWLLKATIEQVKNLKLSNASFMLEPTASNTDEHGPEMTIELTNLTISEIPTQTFGSSAAFITMKSINVLAIRPSAFSAIAYNAVMAINSTFHLIEGESFAQKSLIQQLLFQKCVLYQIDSGAIKSGMTFLNITNSIIEYIDTGAIVSTVAVVGIENTVFKIVKKGSLEFHSYDHVTFKNNSFDELPGHSIRAYGGGSHELFFIGNEIETAHAHSLELVGRAFLTFGRTVYTDVYYGTPCRCNISDWLEDILDVPKTNYYMKQSFCTVEELVARCFNVPDQNMIAQDFVDNVCVRDMTIKCNPFKTKTEGTSIEINNPRFPHKTKSTPEQPLSQRDTKVIGIIVVSVFGCVIVVMLISFIRWILRRGRFMNLRNWINSINSLWHYFCGMLCPRALPGALETTRSISQTSINDFSERRRLNDPPRTNDGIQESSLIEMRLSSSSTFPSDHANVSKATQTLPEELTKELLDNLKARLEDPENYVEAREMIEHLYELIKVEESCHLNSSLSSPVEENIYELPFQNTAPRVGKNKKTVTSVGTKAPSLDRLLPLSPYNRQTALAHEYFEPKDYAVHLYTEITNSDKDRKILMNMMPDILSEQVIPRGPYLMAIRDKINSGASPSTSTTPVGSEYIPLKESTMQSKKSHTSNSSGKMINRPLPQKPIEPVASTSKLN